MFFQDVIGPAQTKWAAPIVFPPKKDGSLYFRVDYKMLGSLIRRNSYLIPRMDECIDSLGEATVFPTLDANDEYGWVKSKEDYKNRTALTSYHGLYCLV